MHGEDVLIEHQCQDRFTKFSSSNFDVEDAQRSGWSVETDKDNIN